jgi:hypothetical protein
VGRERDLLFGTKPVPRPVQPAQPVQPAGPATRVRKKYRKRHVCPVPECGAGFNCFAVFSEHCSIPHEVCPVCRGVFRSLVVHRAAAAEKSREGGRRCAFPPDGRLPSEGQP